MRTPSLFYICNYVLLCTRTEPRTDTDTWDDGRAHGRPADPNPNRTLTADQSTRTRTRTERYGVTSAWMLWLVKALG